MSNLPTECKLCNVVIKQAKNIANHVKTKKHIEKMQTATNTPTKEEDKTAPNESADKPKQDNTEQKKREFFVAKETDKQQTKPPAKLRIKTTTIKQPEPVAKQPEPVAKQPQPVIKPPIHQVIKSSAPVRQVNKVYMHTAKKQNTAPEEIPKRIRHRIY